MTTNATIIIVKPSGYPTSCVIDKVHPPFNAILSSDDLLAPPYFALTGGDISLQSAGTGCGDVATYTYTITTTGTPPGATLTLYTNNLGNGFAPLVSGLSVGDFPYIFPTEFYFNSPNTLKTIQARVVDTGYWGTSTTSGQYDMEALWCGS